MLRPSRRAVRLGAAAARRPANHWQSGPDCRGSRTGGSCLSANSACRPWAVASRLTRTSPCPAIRTSSPAATPRPSRTYQAGRGNRDDRAAPGTPGRARCGQPRRVAQVPAAPRVPPPRRRSSLSTLRALRPPRIPVGVPVSGVLAKAMTRVGQDETRIRQISDRMGHDLAVGQQDSAVAGADDRRAGPDLDPAAVQDPPRGQRQVRGSSRLDCSAPCRGAGHWSRGAVPPSQAPRGVKSGNPPSTITTLRAPACCWVPSISSLS
jgi:hypothetical protein